MRRFCLVAVLLIMLFCVGFAEGSSDYASLSVEELLSMRSDIDAALSQKGYGTVIPDGEYVVGVDIAPGTYVVTAYKTSEAFSVGEYSVWNSLAEMKEYKQAVEIFANASSKWYADGRQGEEPQLNVRSEDYRSVWDVFLEVEQKRITLDEGTVFDVSSYENSWFFLEKATMLFS